MAFSTEFSTNVVRSDDNSRVTSTFADWCASERQAIRDNVAFMDTVVFNGVQRDVHIAMLDKVCHDLADSYTTLLEVLEKMERDRVER